MKTPNSINRSLLLLIFVLFTCIKAQAQKEGEFTINGQLAKDIQGKVMIQYNVHPDVYAQDSSMVVNGAFHIKGKIGDPYFTRLLFIKPGQRSDRTMATADNIVILFLEAANFNVTSTEGLNKAKVTGGKAQADFMQRAALLKDLNDQYIPLMEKMQKYQQAGDMASAADVHKQIAPIMAQQEHIDSVWIKSRPDSYAAFTLWARKQRDDLNPEAITQYNRFTKSVRNSEAGKIMGDKIKMQQKLSVGNVAPDLSAKDTLGKMVSLSSLQGKYVMLLFWQKGYFAEQMFNQFRINMGKISRRLKNKNFVILAVSYDNPQVWHQEIQLITNNNNWIHVTDFGGIKDNGPVSEIGKAYGLNLVHIPQAYLIGPDGKIIVRQIKLGDNDLSLDLDKLVK